MHSGCKHTNCLKQNTKAVALHSFIFSPRSKSFLSDGRVPDGLDVRASQSQLRSATSSFNQPVCGHIQRRRMRAFFHIHLLAPQVETTQKPDTASSVRCAASDIGMEPNETGGLLFLSPPKGPYDPTCVTDFSKALLWPYSSPPTAAAAAVAAALTSPHPCHRASPPRQSRGTAYTKTATRTRAQPAILNDSRCLHRHVRIV